MQQLSLFQKVAAVAVVTFCALLALPNLLSPEQRAALPSFMPNQALTLGLDLQGGAHLVLAVDTADLTTHTLDNLEEEVRLTARENRIFYTNLRTASNGVELTLRDPAQLPNLRKALASPDRTISAGADGEVRITLTDLAWQTLQTNAMHKTVQVLRGRVDEFGVAEPVIQQQGRDRVIVELPGVKDVARAKNSIGRTAMLTFHLVDDNANPTGPIRPDQMKLEEPIGDSGATRTLVVTKRAALTGETLTKAGAGFDQNGGAAVDITFDARGTRQFAKISTENVGKRFAIVLDGKVYSAPVFNEPILGGRAQISGNFTTQEAQDLSAILNAGALPAKVDIIEERTIGPSLGADSIKAGTIALIMGFVFVLAFMFIFYGLFGLFANVALLVNLIIVIGVMSIFGFTLTLPGMAALVLGLGMAVDANVLIFERMREEMANGKKPLASILGGFQGAFSAVLDGNLTALISAVVLFAMGSGPIKGFAVGLGISVAASMFTAITLTRWLCVAWCKAAKPKSLPL